MNRNEETKAVKAALKSVGFAAKVTHGHGTGWGYLRVRVTDATPCTANHDTYNGGTSRGDCPRCHANVVLRQAVLPIIQKVTGRHGEYDGRINVDHA